jgi:hypothetical protein
VLCAVCAPYETRRREPVTDESTPALPALPPIQRAHLCAYDGCGTIVIEMYCWRHRALPAPAGEWAIVARARDESRRTFGETVKETPRDGH